MVFISFFTLCWMVIYLVAKRQYLDSISCRSYIPRNKLNYFAVVAFSLIYFCLNYYYTFNDSWGMPGDRINYKNGFENGLETPSFGLYFIFQMVNHLGYGFEEVALTTTLITLPVVFVSYKYSKYATPRSLLFFLITQYVFNGFVNLKQTYANAFAVLAITVMTNEKTIIGECICLISIVLACLFHPTGYILLSIYILYKSNIRIRKISVVFIYVLLFVVFLEPIMLFIANLTKNVIPFLGDKLLQYFGSEDSEEGRLLVMLKGSVYFYILYNIIRYNRVLKHNIANYDFYVMLVFMGTSFYIVSFYNVWIPRSIEIISFPILVFWSKCIDYLPNKSRKVTFTFLLISFFTYRFLFIIFF